jgi:hypothetical protein
MRLLVVGWDGIQSLGRDRKSFNQLCMGNNRDVKKRVK